MTQITGHADRSYGNTPTLLDIIIIDDNEDIAETLSEVLREQGHRVRIASDGAGALEALEHGAPDVVLLDVGLPDVDGYEVAASIRARFGARVRIVAMTGFTSRHSREQARRCGVDAFLAKPFRVDDVTAALTMP